jgi:glutathione S-transferase
MITVHHLDLSHSQRIFWLLEELELEYSIKRYERDPMTMRAPASFCAIHPLGKSPAISDDHLMISESGAMIEYLITMYGRGRLIPPSESLERLSYHHWLHFAEASAMPPLLMKAAFDKVEHRPMPFLAGRWAKLIASQVKNTSIEPEIVQILAYMETALQQSRWFAGDEFTAADIQMSLPIEIAATQGEMATYPSLMDFLQRIHARPAYNYALERCGAENLSFS